MLHSPGNRIKVQGVSNATTIIIGNSRSFWNHFLSSPDAQFYINQPHPIETYIETTITQTLEHCISTNIININNTHSYRVFWSHSPAETGLEALPDGKGYVGMQRMAVAAGLAYLDEVSHLCLHPKYGPWFSLRACIVFDDIPCAPTKPQPVLLTNPLDAAAQLRVQEAVAKAMQQVEQSKPSMSHVRKDWQRWLAVREAVCPEHVYRYSEDQILYHYTGDRELLKRLVVGIKQEQNGGCI